MVVPHDARRGGGHFGPHGLGDARFGGGPAGPVVATLVVLDPVGLRTGAAFGTSVATAGSLMVVGAPVLGGGVAYVYTAAPGLGGRAPSCVHPTPMLATSSAAPWP